MKLIRLQPASVRAHSRSSIVCQASSGDIVGSRFASTRRNIDEEVISNSTQETSQPAYQPLSPSDQRPSGFKDAPSFSYNAPTAAEVPVSPLVSVARPSGGRVAPLFDKPGGGNGGDNGNQKGTGGDGDGGVNIGGAISYFALYAGLVAAAFVANSAFFQKSVTVAKPVATTTTATKPASLKK